MNKTGQDASSQRINDWNCLNFLPVFVGCQANVSWFSEIVREPSMH